MTSDKLKIALIQDQPGSDIRGVFDKILREKNPDIIAFPEYYFVYLGENEVLSSSSRHDEILKKLKDWSRSFNCAIVGGTMAIESGGGFYNRSYFIVDGEIVGYYDKIHPYKNEGRGSIKEGVEYRVFDFNGLRIGILICADVLYLDSYANIYGLKPDLIFVPTTSPFRENEPVHVKFARDEKLFVRGAEVTGSVIFKVCASGRIGDKRFQARSLIAAPSGILWRNPPEHEDKPALIYAELRDPKNNPRLDIEHFRP